LLGGGLLFHAFGAYVTLLEDDFGWTRTELSIAFSMQRIETGFLGPIQGWMVDRYGPRRVMMVGLTLFGLSFIAFSQIHSLLMFYVVFVLMATGQSLGSMLSLSVSLVSWFRRRRGLALGLVGTGMATGGLLQPIVVAGLEGWGWRTMAFVSGLIILGVGLPLASLVRHTPAEMGLLPDGDVEPEPGLDGEESGGSERARVEEPNFTVREAMLTRSFWLLSLGHAAGLMTVGAMLVHFVPHVTEALDISLGVAARLVMLMTATLVIGMVGAGWLGDRIDKRLIIIVAMIMHLVAMIVLAFVSALVLVAAAAALQGLAWGARGPLTQALRADYFGTASFGKIMGFSAMIIMLGMTVGPLVSGIIYDSTGSYTPAFLLMAGVVALGTLCFVFATPPTPSPHPATSSELERLAD
ncbi:MAG: MFS transporter, partial [Dehalococcoidia bacterium]